jgi:CHASE1-domain containing sensor protein
MGSGLFRPSFDMDNQAIQDVEKGLAAKEEAQESATSKSQSVTSKSQSAQITVTGASLVQTRAKVPNDSDDRECESISNRTIRGGLLLPAWVLTALIVTLGAGTAVAFLAVGITSASQDQEESFERLGADLVKKVQGALEDYVTAASYIHGRCRHRNFTRESFREGYEYLMASGLEFKALQFDPNITHDERYAAEAEAREYYAKYYPHIAYQGFKGFNFVNQTVPEPRVNASFYFPIHYMEPIVGNEAAIDLDYFAEGSPQRHETVLYCMQHGMPGITERLRLVQETEEVAYGVVLMHPYVG